MKHDWKPGDVAMVTVNGGDEMVAVRGSNGWVVEPASLPRRRVTDARPLVAIDPEGREVNRLIHLLGTHYRGSCADMREAFWALLNPPKPEEPTGLGAVVEDRDGQRYVRSERHEDAPWDKFREYVGGFLWSDIPAIRVLSEGVQP